MNAVLLALTPLDALSNRHLKRAAQLAAATGMRLRLAYCEHGPRRFASPLARLENRARHLSRQFGQPVESVDEDVSTFDALRRHVGAGTVICTAPPARRRPWFGTRGDGLSNALRLQTVPVLAMHRDTDASYRHVLVPVSLRDDAEALARCAAAAALAPRARLDIFHAAALPPVPAIRHDEAHSIVLDHFLRKARIDTLRRMTTLSRGLRNADSTMHHTNTRPVRDCIVAHQRATAHDLIVVRTTPRETAWPRFRLPLAMTLVGAVQADVLIIPQSGTPERQRFASWRGLVT